jgi:hypothetical protein
MKKYNQSINQSSDPPVKQLMEKVNNQSINQSSDPSVKRLMGKANNQSINRKIIWAIGGFMKIFGPE